MATVQHPAFSDVTQEVSESEAWVDQGWLLVSDKEPVLVDKMPKVSGPGDSAHMPERGRPEDSPPPVAMPDASKASGRDKK